MRVVVGERVGGSAQELFAGVTIELIYQLLRGEVDEADIGPKVVSIVRKTLS